MRKLAALLALTTGALAISTVHYARLLHAVEETATAGMPQSAALDNAAATRVAPEPEILLGVALQAAGDANDLVSAAESPSPYSARERLEALRNPAEREQRLKTASALLRESWRAMAEDLGLSETEVESVAARLADLALQNSERSLVCQVDPDCDFEALRNDPGMSQDSLIAKVLTADQFARYQAGREAWTENTIAFEFSMQLAPADAMSRATRDRLVQALVALRRQLEREAAARGETFQGLVGSAAHSIASQPTASEMARQRATANANREIAAAAGVLSPAQQALYRQRVEGRLYTCLEDLHEQEIAAAAREAAGLPR